MAHASLYGSSSWMIHTVDCMRHEFQLSVEITVACLVCLFMVLRLTARAYRLAVR